MSLMFLYVSAANMDKIFTIDGNANGAPCVFPFSYKGHEYNECTVTSRFNF